MKRPPDYRSFPISFSLPFPARAEITAESTRLCTTTAEITEESIEIVRSAQVRPTSERSTVTTATSRCPQEIKSSHNVPLPWIVSARLQVPNQRSSITAI